MVKRRMMVAKVMNVDSNDTMCHDQLCIGVNGYQILNKEGVPGIF